MGYKQKGFSKHATKSAYKRVDDIETQGLISSEIKNILKSGGTDKDVREFVDKTSDMATTYYYDKDGNVRTSKRVLDTDDPDMDMENLYKIRKKDGKYDYDEVGGKKKLKFDEVPNPDPSNQNFTSDKEGNIIATEKDGKEIKSGHESGSMYEQPNLIGKVRNQEWNQRRNYDALEQDDFSGFDTPRYEE